MDTRGATDSDDVADVVVVGSINVDVVAELDRFPRPGETVAASTVRRSVGGKGANQAVAARRAGARVAFVGRVGDDADGAWLRDEVASAEVDVSRVSIVRSTRSGTAFIQIAGGENTIVLDGGANQYWDGADGACVAAVRDAHAVVCQMEIPDEMIADVAALVSPPTRFVLNAAPARPLAAAVLCQCDPLVVNQHELATLADVGMDADAVDADSAIGAAAQLVDGGANSVVVTLGAHGAVWVDGSASGRVAAPRVEVVDSTGAGDAFVGTLATRIARGDTMDRAVREAVTAGARAVTIVGTF